MRRGRRGVGMIAVDLFAGPGGWDVAAASLGIDALGIEWDAAACRVREAAGHRTLQADVADLDPHDFPCDLLIASPPCTAFSMAGKGEGRKVLDELVGAMYDLGKSEANSWQTHGPYPLSTDDETARLVLEPLRWALAIRPRMVACEQVPPVLPLWEAMAQVLRAEGYHAWTGILSAERFGVPQTRKRAFLIASLDGPVGEPLATHQRYVAPLRRDDIGAGLFDLPDPERIVARGEDNLLPWVSMAEALGWAEPDSSVVTNNFGSNRGPNGERSENYERDADQPSPTVGSRADLWQLRSNARTNSAVRGADEPAPTITAGHDHNERVWVPTHLDVRRQEGAVLRAVEDPSPTVTAEGLAFRWRSEATRSRSGHAVRVTMEQAACLQSFPSGYPWEAAGSRSAAFRCIGNAVPPPMAQAVLREAIGGSDHE